MDAAVRSVPVASRVLLHSYAASQGYASRSAVLHEAVRLLRASELGPAYEDACEEWARSGDDQVWDTAAADGVN